ncbi:glucosylceramidase-like [Acanthaster planci]|uniref:Glucosylceramidase n=1 Tax=Acanthaster planci TaxID=133434 RepID=A0A8B7Z408_ACAPL|nr:glucosylceramidase-like [Acanthaster planci]
MILLLGIGLLTAFVLPCKATACRRATTDILETTSFVCECSAEYCDTIPRDVGLRAGQYVIYSSTKDRDRFHRTTYLFEDRAEHDQRFVLDASREYQTILGFGGSFTDSATMNIKSISPSAQHNLLKSYFSSEGIEYSMGRIPMSSCDFSVRVYSYDDHPGDFALEEFMLATEDISYKIPVIKEALAMSPHDIKLLGSPWSAPAWMKTNQDMVGGALMGQPGEKYYKTWATYFVKFLEAYEQHQVPMWGLTIQNEPSGAEVPFNLYSWQSMAMPPETAKDFVKRDLGPALTSNGYSHVKLMSHDDNIPSVLANSKVIYEDEEAAKFLSGIAVHWYMTKGSSTYNSLEETHQTFPDKFLLATEACEGYQPWEQPVKLGNWERGEQYSLDILQDLKHWVTGWVDWNLALDLSGGPNWAGNNVDSPIIVDAERDVFYKQPMFYHMGHFSKFIYPGSVHIDLRVESQAHTTLHSIAFKRPDNSTVIVLLNVGASIEEVTVHDPRHGYINTKLPPRSIHTFIW